MLATGRIGDQYLKRCNVPLQGTGSPNVFANMIAVRTVGKQTIPYQEIVPCPKCCQTHVAPVITGSPKVFVNGISIGRLSSLALGITGSFPETVGSPNVFVT